MHISELNSLRDNQMIRFKEEVLDGQSLTIVHYMISNTELWDKAKSIVSKFLRKSSPFFLGIVVNIFKSRIAKKPKTED